MLAEPLGELPDRRGRAPGVQQLAQLHRPRADGLGALLVGDGDRLDAEPGGFLGFGLPADHQGRGQVEGRVAPVLEQRVLDARDVVQGDRVA